MDRVDADGRHPLVRRVLSALRAELEACGYGAITLIERRLRLRRDFIRSSRRRGLLRVDKLASILEVLGIEPAAFFHRALPTTDPPPRPPLRPTRRNQTLARINRALSTTFEACGRGSVARTERVLGLQQGFIRNNRRAGRLEMGRLGTYLQALGIEPAPFFRHAFAAGAPQADGVGDPVVACGAEAGMLPRSRVAFGLITAAPGAPVAALTPGERAQLARLDALRYENHAAARAKAEKLCRTALHRDHPQLAIRAAGVAASACRLALALDDAQLLLWGAYQLAERIHDESAATDLIQRMAYVTADRGRYEYALALADRALLRYQALQDEVGMGRLHVKRGTLLRKMGVWGQALEAFRVALELLPDEELKFRITAFHSSARIYLDRNDIRMATACVEAISRYHLEGEVYEGRLAWLSAQVAMQREDYDRAEAYYLDTIAAFDHASSPGDAALAAIELVRLYLKLGRRYDARAIAQGMQARIFQLPQNDVLASAAWELLRLGQDNEISLELVNELLAKLKSGRPQTNEAARGKNAVGT